MLVQLTITNFAIVKSLELEFAPGMTTITGETGAGKSIAIDALSLCLGERADASMVRPGEEKAEISACFRIEKTQAAKQWLAQHDLESGDECIIRRVITKEGRSRAYINASPVPASQLKALGHTLIHIHGQHAHQLLTKSESQLAMLDHYAGHHQLLFHCQQQYRHWQQQRQNWQDAINNQTEYESQRQLLEYQVDELDEFSLAEQEYEALEAEHRILANGSQLSEHCRTALAALSETEDGNSQQTLNTAIKALEQLSELDERLQPQLAMLHEAAILLSEASQELYRYQDDIEMDPTRFEFVEARLGQIHRLAKKHQVEPKMLYHHHQHLLAELKAVSGSGKHIEELEALCQAAAAHYQDAALTLSNSRQSFADELNHKISQSMHQLGMEKGQFEIDFDNDMQHAKSNGIDRINFLVSTNPGQPLQPLAKVASGGELSRISLAIQVITAQKIDTPSLIFDEVDVGISGPTAAVVGQMLRKLGDATQVLCVTHLPQVAGAGHQQMFVTKRSAGDNTETSMTPLNEQQRIRELARLLGGSKITESTLANARELLIAA